MALSSTNAIEHLSLPYDPASRRLFGVPIVATVSEAAGVGHVLARDAVVLDTDASASECSGRRHPTPMTSRRSGPAARPVWDLGAVPAGRGVLRFDGLSR